MKLETRDEGETRSYFLKYFCTFIISKLKFLSRIIESAGFNFLGLGPELSQFLVIVVDKFLDHNVLLGDVGGGDLLVVLMAADGGRTERGLQEEAGGCREVDL